MKRNLTAIVAVVAGVLVLGAALAFYFTQRPTAEHEASTQSTATGTSAPKIGGKPLPVGFSFQRLSIDTSGTRPEACLVFSAALDQSGNTQYGDYITLDPKVEHAVRVNGNALCISGLGYADQYKATIKAGLPSAKGEKTQYAETVPISLSNRPPAISFSGGIILPRQSAGKVPVTTVNISQLKIKVLRVGDRMLSQLHRGLIDSSKLYDYDTQQIEDQLGALVWQGEMDVQGAKNQTVTTLIPLHEAIKNEKPGVYLILASNAKAKDNIKHDYSGTSAQWVIDTDIGLTTFDGADGLHVFARHLSNADPLQGTEIALVAQNDEVLARIKTDAAGEAHFNAELMNGKGGNEPAVIMAYGAGGDFSYLDLRRPAFDLTDRGVSGRAEPGPIDAFLYLDRGIYRPGESVYVTTLLRDVNAKAIDDSPLTLIARRPDGVEYRRVVTKAGAAGGTAASFPLSMSAPLGRWQISAYVDPTEKPVGRVSFDVQDFVPERLKVTLKPQAKFYKPGDEVGIGVDGRFLYGAPASHMNGEGEMHLAVDPNPFPKLEGYQFGRVEDTFSGRLISLQVPTTDDKGHTVATGKIALRQKTTHPLLANINIGLTEPGGRQTRAHVSVPVRTSDLMIGIRPGFKDDWVRENTPASFEVLAVDAQGTPVPRQNLTWRLVREVVNYQWYEVNGRWEWERQTRDLPVKDGIIDTAPDEPGTVKVSENWGSYRLIVSDAKTGASSSVRYFVGWGGSASADRPDRVAVTLDKDKYKVGDTATINIRPPSDGKALVLIASNKVFEQHLIDVPKSGYNLQVKVSKDWGTGVYALVTHFRGTGEGNSRAPVRSIGLAWLGIDHSAKTLSVDIAAPDKVKPQTSVELPVQVKGAKGQTYLTLAAVDEGILQLTDFKSPDPSKYYFGKRRLGLDIRDDYGRLIQPLPGDVGELRSGGGAMGAGAALDVVPTKTVALYSGIVTLGPDGKGKVRFDIPDYVGELRLMAVAYNDSQVGEGEAKLTVRGPVVADLSLPRFLAPKDKAFGTLLVDNVEGLSGTYRVAVKSSGAVDENTSNFSLKLDKGVRKSVLVPLTGGDPGIGTISLALTGPGGIKVSRNWPIQVRPAQRPITRGKVAELAPGASLTLDKTMFAGLYPATAKLSVTLASQRAFDVPGLLRWLDRYPYGCLEQTTSRAYPLLSYNALAAQVDVAQDVGLKRRIQNSVDKILDMQSPSGNFAMWGWGGSPANDWLSVFAADFLLSAKDAGYVVPQDALNRMDRWLRGSAAQSWEPRYIRSYAMYVLARQGAINLSDLRYFHDTELPNISTPMAAAELGAALSAMGDRARAYSAFQRAEELAAHPIPEKAMPPYGTDLREVAGATAFAARAGDTAVLPDLFKRIEELKGSLEATTTQEKAWMLLAANALSKIQGPVSVKVSGVQTVGAGEHGPVYLASLKPDEVGGVQVKNTGDKQVWYSASVDGTPIEPQPAQSSAVTISKAYYNLDGTPADLSKLKQSQRLIVVITGKSPDIKRREMAITDLLPAGIEIESPLSPGAEGAYSWMPALTKTSLNAKRDDRYVAAFTLRGSIRKTKTGQTYKIIPHYTVAYLARAVTPGTFTLPAASVEDMYAPGVHARTAMGEVTVTAPDGG